jgi:exonuclease I
VTKHEALLQEHLAMETEGERVQMLPFQLLEDRRFELVMRMTARRFGELSPVEKRNYCRWAEHFRDVFAEKARLFERHTPADIDLPTFLTRINP